MILNEYFHTVVNTMVIFPFRATTNEVQLGSHEWEQELPIFAYREASTNKIPVPQ